MKIDLINDILVVKMHKTTKKALLIGASILVLLVVLFVILGDKLGIISDYLFIILGGYIVLYFALYMVWLIATSRQKYKTVTFDFNRFYLEGPYGQLEIKYAGLAYIEIDEEYSPDMYINFVYNEEKEYKFMIHKNSWPALARFFDEHRLNYQFKSTAND